MKYQITSDNIQLSSSMETLAKEKFERLERRIEEFVPEDSRFARIVLNSAPDGQFTVKANVTINGKEYFSDETHYTLETALVETVEELVQMMEKDKDSHKRKQEKPTGVDEETLLQETGSDVQ